MITVRFTLYAEQADIQTGSPTELVCSYNEFRRAIVSADLEVPAVGGTQLVSVEPRVAMALLGFPSVEKLEQMAATALRLQYSEAV